VIGMSLNIEKAYGFSFGSRETSTGFILKKSTKDDSRGSFSFFFEEEDLNESEDDSSVDLPLLWANNSLFTFKLNLNKVLFSIPEKFLYFQQYSHPLFIVFRNLRL